MSKADPYLFPFFLTMPVVPDDNSANKTSSRCRFTVYCVIFSFIAFGALQFDITIFLAYFLKIEYIY